MKWPCPLRPEQRDADPREALYRSTHKIRRKYRCTKRQEYDLEGILQEDPQGDRADGKRENERGASMLATGITAGEPPSLMRTGSGHRGDERTTCL